MQYAFYFDQTACTECSTCTVACKDWNQVRPGPVRWRRQETHELDSGFRFMNLVMSCNHCARPACVDACTQGAIQKRADGIVAVDRARCSGLELCIEACPFSAPHIADDAQEPVRREEWVISHPMQKCTFCWERLDRGEKPVCVSSCPANALDYGDSHELQRLYPEAELLSYERFPYAYKTKGDGSVDTTTAPSLLIRPRRQLKITSFS